MENDDTAAKRLNTIWREWSLANAAERKQQRDALASLEKHLDGGDAAVVLRGVQALLADPELPGVGKRALFRSFWECVDEEWPGAGAEEGHVQQLQAMLLAAWPREPENGWFGMLPMLVSPWDVVRGRGAPRQQIEQWLEDAVRGRDAELNVQRARVTAVPTSGLSKLKGIAETITKVEAQIAARYPQPNQYNVAGPEAQPLVKHLIEAVQTTHANFVELSAWLARMHALSQNQGERADALSELLWWGQARYCHTLRKPFRRLNTGDACLWWAAWEAAERAQALPVEPAASYLQEVLHALGHDLDEQQPLSAWMRRLHESLHGSDEAPSVSAELAEPVAEDALGLPVTWVRLHAGEAFNEERARQDVALPLDVLIDRGQWTAWVYREILLDHFVADRDEEE